MLKIEFRILIYFFCHQEEDLDSQQGVIDFSLYLRSKRDLRDDDSTGSSSSLANSTHGGTTRREFIHSNANYLLKYSKMNYS